ncbi:unnamed protein product [Ceratitis capitata]|uniref:(Mediterranean fruit fly) hypothetical protein n=1 Tax=Ceratitis capitata TaxID=7213 RepID=A0A811UKT5_CERCA|nr:unnamed protein product [Ceratitis capitata]
MSQEYFFKLFKYVLLFILCILNTNPVAATSCRTPFGALGDQQPLSDCKPLLDFVHEYGSKMTVVQTKFLEMSFVNNTQRIICCDLEFEPKRAFQSIGREILRNQAESCGDNTRKRISFGSESTFLAHPWSVLLIYSSGYKFQCGGTVITNRYVLTAAHCVTMQLVAVRLGEHNTDLLVDCELDEMDQEHCLAPAIDVAIERAIKHNHYSEALSNSDIALLRLGQQIHFIDSVKPICIPEYQGQEFQKRFGIIGGWGATENSSFSNVHREAEIPIISRDSCQAVYKRRAVDETKVCTRGAEGENTCKGDSGGPLTVRVEGHEDGTNRKFRYMQIGVISLGFRDCGVVKGTPAIYTNVAAFIDWIALHIEL